MASLVYGTKTNITITLASLTDTSLRQSASVDNGTNGAIDTLIGGKITTGTGSSTNDFIDIYAAGSLDGGTTFSGDASGSDAAYSGVTENLKFLGRISTETASTTYEFGPFSLAAAFGGSMPEDWAIVVDNESDSTLSATGGNHEVHYLEITTA